MAESSVAVARQYAEAAFALATDAGAVDRWLEELQTVAVALREERVRQILESPRLSDEQKAGVVRSSLAGVEPQLLNLVLLLTQRRRLNFLGVVAAEFSRLVDERRGIVVAEVTTAVPLDDQYQRIVAQRLSSAFGKQVRLRTNVDRSIIAGMVIKVGDRMINGSVAGRLASLRRGLV